MGQVKNRAVIPFTPTILRDEDFSVYEPEFAAVFENRNVTNIAVSGPFGAGKTSVMNTWEKSRAGSKHSYLHLSLANFRGTGQFQEKECGDTNKIEEMLLNQLVHKIPSHKIPKSRFRKTSSGWKSIAGAVALTVLIVLLVVLGLCEFDWYQSKLADGVAVSAMKLALPWIVPLIVLIFVSCSFRPFRGLIRKVSLGGNSVELFDEDSSAFNKYMDDVLYLFASSGCDVVVIEDLDRFERLNVFEDLREINSLLNAKRNPKKPIRFFYLVRDDMFSSRDRAKFFDSIIPVIPHADSNNAADILAPELARVGINIDVSFGEELSLYLNDPRIINDVVDNSGHVKAALFDQQGVELKEKDAERIVAISVYKALFPSDYSDLQVGRGCVKYFLGKKAELVENRRGQIGREISECNRQHGEIETRVRYSADEFALLYLTDEYYELERYYNGYHSVSLKSMKPADRVKVIRDNSSMASRFDECIRDLCERDDEFKNRYEAILEKPENEKNSLDVRIAGLKSELLQLSRTSLSETLESVEDSERALFFELPPIDSISEEMKETYDRMVSTRESSDFGLIKYLLTSGYIDDSYERYMSNFYPTSVSSSDREVLRQIVQYSATDSHYRFERAEAAAKKLSPERYCQRNARIYSLFHELLADESLADRRERFLEGINTDGDLRFLLTYVVSDYGEGESICSLEKCRPGTMEEIIKTLSDDVADVRCVCQKILVWAPKLLDDAQIKKSIACFASSDNRFLKPEIALEASIGDSLEKIGYIAEDLVVEDSHETTLADVYIKGLYMPTAVLALKLVKSQHPGYGDLAGPMLSNVLYNHDKWPVRARVDACPVEYLKSAISEFGKLDDAEKTVAWLVNKPEIQEEDGLMELYASALEGRPIANVEVIQDVTAMEVLAANDRIVRTGRNILMIYAMNGNGVTDAVAGLTNTDNAPQDLTIEEAKSIVQDGDFLLDLGRSPLVDGSAFAAVASVYGAKYDNLEITDLPIDRAKSLATSNSIEMTRENLVLYDESYPAAVIDLAASDIDGYVRLVFDEDAQDCVFDEDVALGLLRTGLESPSLVRLVEGFDGPQRIDLNSYSEGVNAAIIENCFDEDDIALLGEAYRSATGNMLKDAIASRCCTCLGVIVRDKVNLPMELRLKLLSDPGIESREKVRLISIGCGSYKASEYSEMFLAAKLDAYCSALNKMGHDYMVGSGNETKTILEDLKRLNLISSYKMNEMGQYMANAKRKKK